MRELEQCVRNVLIRGTYWPRRTGTATTDALPEGLRHGTLTADELVQWYCATVRAQTGSDQETARRLGLDRRTVRAKVSAWTHRGRDGADE